MNLLYYSMIVQNSTVHYLTKTINCRRSLFECAYFEVVKGFWQKPTEVQEGGKHVSEKELFVTVKRVIELEIEGGHPDSIMREGRCFLSFEKADQTA